MRTILKVLFLTALLVYSPAAARSLQKKSPKRQVGLAIAGLGELLASLFGEAAVGTAVETAVRTGLVGTGALLGHELLTHTGTLTKTGTLQLTPRPTQKPCDNKGIIGRCDDVCIPIYEEGIDDYDTNTLCPNGLTCCIPKLTITTTTRRPI